MTEEQVRQIIREEFGSLIRSDRYTFEKLIQMLDGRNIQTGRTIGTKIGTATDQLIGFYGVTPVNQPATVSDALTYSLTGADTVSKTQVETDLTACADAINAIIDRLQELGLVA